MAQEQADRGDVLAVDDESAVVDQQKQEAIDDKKAEQPDNKGDEKVDDKETDGKTDEPAQPRDKTGKFTADRIPVAEHKRVLERERASREAVERRLAELEAQLQAVDKSVKAEELESEIAELEKAHAKAAVDGDVDKAAALMAQIRTKERQVVIAQSTSMTAQSKEEAREDIRTDLVIERLQEEYPQLNEAAEEFDQEAVDLVLALQASLMKTDRLPPSKALATAAKRVMGRLVATKEPEPEVKGLQAAKEAADRKAAQVDKNLKTAEQQPASMKDAGADSDKAGIKSDVDVSKLSFDEFNALPESTKSRLRGDLAV